MNRSLRNTIMIIILVLCLGSLGFTTYLAYKSFKWFYYGLFFLEAIIFISLLIYLFMSEFNYKYLDEVFKEPSSKIVFVLLSIILSILVSFSTGMIVNKFNDKDIVIEEKKEEKKEDIVEDKEEVIEDRKEEVEIIEDKSRAVKEIVSEEEITSDIESVNTNENIIIVKDGGNAKIKGAILRKSGDFTDTEEDININAGILVEAESKLEIIDSTISSKAKGSNVVVAKGNNALINIMNSKIESSGNNSSVVVADNRGSIDLINSDLTTNGKSSPIMYSKGDINVSDSKGVANTSQMVIIESKSSVNINNSSFLATGEGSNSVDNAGILIYQDMADIYSNKAVFNVVDSFLEIAKSSPVYKTAPMFLVTNNVVDINIKNTRLTYGSNILLSVVGTSEWGEKGNNGGVASLNGINQSLKGNIIVDNISTLDFNLVNSTYRGTINGSNSAQKIVLKIDKDSKITLTGDSYVSKLENANSVNSNIDFNGYNLYVDGVSLKL